MAQVWIAIHGGTAHIHAHIGLLQGLKQLLAPRQSIVDKKIMFHNYF